LVGVIDAARPRGPGATASLFRVVSSFVGWLDVVGLLSPNPLPRRAQSTLAPAVKPRTRVLDDAELATVWRASEGLPRKGRVFTRLLLLNGVRRSEAAGIAAGEVDRAAAAWVIPSTRAKNRAKRVVALSGLALAEIATVWPAIETRPHFRLLGRTGSTPLSGFSALKRRLDALAPIPSWDWHDLRRTCRTGLARLGVDDATAEAAIGHLSGRSPLVRVYDQHRREAEAAEALLRWQQYIAVLVAPETMTGEVVPLHRGRADAA
jgi:integrase